MSRSRKSLTSTRGLAACLGLVLAISTMDTAAQGPTQAKARLPMPELRLSGESRGESAVSALGTALPTIAAHYRMSPERLRHILRRDGTSRVDARGRLFHVELPANEVEGASEPSVSLVAPYPLAESFALNSKPGSARVIYLDFNGHSTGGTAWNGGAAINAQAFDTDGIPSSFSNAELTAIQKIWQRVAEDYAPFDVNVTTADPGIEAIHRNSSSDSQFGSRVVITRNSFYNCSCGGVAYVGTFDYVSSSAPGYYQPAWVFFDALGNGNEKFVAEAASHEAGHNLGLSHDGNATTGYYGGHGSGETGWAPIMGTGYNRNLSQWSRGEYSLANNLEDDVLVITQNGALLRADDAGNSISSAATLSGISDNGSVIVARNAIIGQGSDVDVYAFATGNGLAQFNLTPAAPGPNVDLRVELLDSAGNLLASANPADSLSASVSVSLSAGTYYLRVDGMGKGDPGTGYSDYGSIGQYAISGSYADMGAAAPIAMFSAAPSSGTAPLPVSFDAGSSSDSDGYIARHAWNFGDGTSADGVTATHTYAAGNYTATLTVTDNQGLSSSRSIAISATSAQPVQPKIFIKSISVSAAKVIGGYQCSASVTIQNDSSKAVPAASVIGTWSGTVSGNASGTTNSSGIAVIKSARTTRRGTCTFRPSSVSASGSTYTPSLNKATSGSRSY